MCRLPAEEGDGDSQAPVAVKVLAEVGAADPWLQGSPFTGGRVHPQKGS